MCSGTCVPKWSAMLKRQLPKRSNLLAAVPSKLRQPQPTKTALRQQESHQQLMHMWLASPILCSRTREPIPQTPSRHPQKKLESSPLWVSVVLKQLQGYRMGTMPVSMDRMSLWTTRASSFMSQFSHQSKIHQLIISFEDDRT